MLSASRFDTDDLDDLDDVDEPKPRRKGGGIVKFVANVFSKYFGVLLWCMLIGYAIFGFVYGGMSDSWDGAMCLLGLLIGAVVGFFMVITFGGLISIFIVMGENIAKTQASIVETLTLLKKNTNAANAANRVNTANAANTANIVDSFEIGGN